MRQTIKLFVKRFNIIIPLVLLVMLASVIGGVFEILSSSSDYLNSNAEIIDNGNDTTLYFLNFISLINDMAITPFIFLCFILAIMATYKNEYKYSYNLGCTKGNNIVANMLLGLAIGIMVVCAVVISFIIAQLIYANKYKYGMAINFPTATMFYQAGIYFLMFTAFYSLFLLLTKLFQRNKLIFILALGAIVLAYCCMVTIPINIASATNPYYLFIISWKGQITVPIIGAALGYASYILLSYKMEVKR